MQFSIESWYILIPIFFLCVAFLLKSPKCKGEQYLLTISFVVYALCVIHLVFFPIDVFLGDYRVLTPWYNSINYIPVLTIDVTTFLLNIIMLIPLGLYLPLLKKDSFKQVLYIGFAVTISFEVIQLILRIFIGNGRSVDINDIIANTLGVVCGYVFYVWSKKMKPIHVLYEKIKL